MVHTDPPTSFVHHQTASNDQPGPSKSIATEGRDGEENIDFSLASMRSVRSGTKSRRVTWEPSGDIIHVSKEKDGNSPVSTEMQIKETVIFQEQVEKSNDNSKIKKKTDTPRNAVNVDMLKWSIRKRKDHAKECNLCRNISFTIDGTTDVKNPLK